MPSKVIPKVKLNIKPKIKTPKVSRGGGNTDVCPPGVICMDNSMVIMLIIIVFIIIIIGIIIYFKYTQNIYQPVLLESKKTLEPSEKKTETSIYLVDDNYYDRYDRRPFYYNWWFNPWRTERTDVYHHNQSYQPHHPQPPPQPQPHQPPPQPQPPQPPPHPPPPSPPQPPQPPPQPQPPSPPQMHTESLSAPPAPPPQPEIKPS